MTQLQWMSVGGSVVVIGFFALRAVVNFARAADRLEIATRTCDYLIAAIDERRLPDLRFDTIDVSKKLTELRAVLGDAKTAAAKKLRFRRSALADSREILENLERAKTSTEILPLCGVLGTAVGFLTTNYLGSGRSAVDNGLWLALSSTVLALAATILLKWFYEGQLVPQYVHLQQQTVALEQAIEESGEEILAIFTAPPPVADSGAPDVG